MRAWTARPSRGMPIVAPSGGPVRRDARRQPCVDHGHAPAFVQVLVGGEPAPLQEAGADRLEVPRGDHAEVRATRAPLGHGLTGEPPRLRPAPTRQGERAREPHAADTGHVAHGFLQRAHQAGALGGTAVGARHAHRDVEDERAFGVEARIHPAERLGRSQEEPRAQDEHDRHRHLRHDEGLPRPTSVEATLEESGRRAPFRPMQPRLEDREAGEEQGDAPPVAASTKASGTPGGSTAKRANDSREDTPERPCRAPRHQERRGTAEQQQEGPLEQDGAKEPPARGTERHAHRPVALARHPPCQEERGQGEAGDEEHALPRPRGATPGGAARGPSRRRAGARLRGRSRRTRTPAPRRGAPRPRRPARPAPGRASRPRPASPPRRPCCRSPGRPGGRRPGRGRRGGHAGAPRRPPPCRCRPKAEARA